MICKILTSTNANIFRICPRFYHQYWNAFYDWFILSLCSLQAGFIHRTVRKIRYSRVWYRSRLLLTGKESIHIFPVNRRRQLSFVRGWAESKVIATTFFLNPQIENKNIELKLGRRVSKGRLMNENLKLDEVLCKSFDFLSWSGKTGLFKAIIFRWVLWILCSTLLFFLSFPPNPKTNYERRKVFSIEFVILSPK